MRVSGVVCVEFDYFPGNALRSLRLVHDTDGPKVVRCSCVLKARWDKDLNNGCYLFFVGPTPEVLTTDCCCVFLNQARACSWRQLKMPHFSTLL